MDNYERHSAEFLLTEYRICMDEYQRSEEVGEKRMNFFITLATAVLAALVALATGKKGSNPTLVALISLCGLVSLLLLGIATLTRLIRRNLVSTKQLRAMARIRSYFTVKDSSIEKYLSFPAHDDQPQRRKEWKELLSFGTGGLVETIALVNSIIVAAICAQSITVFHKLWPVLLFILAGFVAAWVFQFAYVKSSYKKGLRI